MELHNTTCSVCGTQSRIYSPTKTKLVNIGQHSGSVRLETLLRNDTKAQEIEGYTCDTCKGATMARRTENFIKLPNQLAINLGRFPGGKKSFTKVTWDLDNFDFSEFLIRGDGRDGGMDSGSLGSSIYECYAIIIHDGNTIKSGHYWAYIRDPRTSAGKKAWLRCEDSKVEALKLQGSTDGKHFGHLNAVPYVMFFRKRYGS